MTMKTSHASATLLFITLLCLASATATSNAQEPAPDAVIEARHQAAEKMKLRHSERVGHPFQKMVVGKPGDPNYLVVVFTGNNVNVIDGVVTGKAGELPGRDRVVLSGKEIQILDTTGSPLLVITKAEEPAEVERLNQNIDAPRAYLGVTFTEPDEALSAAAGVAGGAASLVSSVVKGTAADRAGIRKYDIILKADDRLGASPSLMREIIARKKPGEKIDIRVFRAGKVMDLTATLDAMDPVNANAAIHAATMESRALLELSVAALADKVKDLAREKSDQLNATRDQLREKELIARDVALAKQKVLRDNAAVGRVVSDGERIFLYPESATGGESAESRLEKTLKAIEERMILIEQKLARLSSTQEPAKVIEEIKTAK